MKLIINLRASTRTPCSKLLAASCVHPCCAHEGRTHLAALFEAMLVLAKPHGLANVHTEKHFFTCKATKKAPG